MGSSNGSDWNLVRTMTAKPNDRRIEPDESIQEWIDRLDLIVHPEGGWYRETYRSGVVLGRDGLPAGYPGDRTLMTSILYLLPTGMRSRWHRVRSEELWMHHRGDDLSLRVRAAHPRESGPSKAAADSETRLGQGPEAKFQSIVPPGHWQEAEALAGSFGFSLVGCVVAPGFEFEDFEMAASVDRAER
jgi:predicted cupin superfamily sugar epimerase